MVIFQLIGTIASLYLPALNAEIIDDGVAKGDTDFILSTGMVMLAITVLQIICTIIAVYFGARTAMGFGRDVRAALFHQVPFDCPGGYVLGGGAGDQGATACIVGST